jgi:hypothetical protein
MKSICHSVRTPLNRIIDLSDQIEKFPEQIISLENKINYVYP